MHVCTDIHYTHNYIQFTQKQYTETIHTHTEHTCNTYIQSTDKIDTYKYVHINTQYTVRTYNAYS